MWEAPPEQSHLEEARMVTSVARRSACSVLILLVVSTIPWGALATGAPLDLAKTTCSLGLPTELTPSCQQWWTTYDSGTAGVRGPPLPFIGAMGTWVSAVATGHGIAVTSGATYVQLGQTGLNLSLSTGLSVSPWGDPGYSTNASLGGALTGRLDGQAAAFDTTDGKVLWSTRLAASKDPNASQDGIHVAQDASAVFVGVPPPDGLGAYENRVALSPDGTEAFIVGAVTLYGGLGTFGMTTTALDARDGHVLWTRTLQTSQRTFLSGAGATAVTLGSAGRTVIVTGSLSRSDAGQDAYVVAYDPHTGDQKWLTKVTAPGGKDEPVGLAASPDGARVFMASTSFYGADSGYDFTTYALNATTGAVEWSARYSGPEFYYGDERPIGIVTDGSSVVVGGTSVTRRYASSMALVAYDANSGVKRWETQIHGVDRDHGISATAFGVAGPSRVAISGTGYGGYSGLATSVYDTTTGALIWNHSAPAEAVFTEGFYPLGIASDKTGDHVAIAGAHLGPFSAAFETTAFDAQGTPLWTVRSNEPTSLTSYARTIVPTEDGASFLVAGQVLNPWGMDVGMARYLASGPESFTTIPIGGT